ncbi:hypothetical protein G6M78_06890 [Agrobacterium tumefaciens]|uniref:hypothetical protein n=1 Tax=Agrobacterium tumefaciens TaxID=358 RepID=UPI0015735306|nr:hypothetical protein [Agrobacterium tumefaciens]NTE54801.1 hypothetical protein [Agrobacterium tumefaciens]NTE73569.1 hypothetical protein [Agrobacterium tumefaciens]
MRAIPAKKRSDLASGIAQAKRFEALTVMPFDRQHANAETMAGSKTAGRSADA